MPIRLFRNTLLIIALTTYCRLFFYVLNSSYFPDLEPSVFFYGLRFDLVSIAYLFSGFYLVSLIPTVNSENKWKRVFMSIFFQIGLNLTLLINFIDSIYYNFTFKRSTGDVFSLAGTGNDFERLIPQFLKDFWYVVLIYLISVWAFSKLYKITSRRKVSYYLDSYKKWVLHFFLLGL